MGVETIRWWYLGELNLQLLRTCDGSDHIINCASEYHFLLLPFATFAAGPDIIAYHCGNLACTAAGVIFGAKRSEEDNAERRPQHQGPPLSMNSFLLECVTSFCVNFPIRRP